MNNALQLSNTNNEDRTMIHSQKPAISPLNQFAIDQAARQITSTEIAKLNNKDFFASTFTMADHGRKYTVTAVGPAVIHYSYTDWQGTRHQSRPIAGCQTIWTRTPNTQQEG